MKQCECESVYCGHDEHECEKRAEYVVKIYGITTSLCAGCAEVAGQHAMSNEYEVVREIGLKEHKGELVRSRPGLHGDEWMLD